MNIKILNYKIHIDFSFIFFITLLFFINKSFFVISALLASMIHEFGHLIMLKKTTKANKIDIKAFCKKKGISYGSFSRILREHTDLKVSNLFLIAEMLKIEDINELLRKVH